MDFNYCFIIASKYNIHDHNNEGYVLIFIDIGIDDDNPVKKRKSKKVQEDENEESIAEKKIDHEKLQVCVLANDSCTTLRLRMLTCFASYKCL